MTQEEMLGKVCAYAGLSVNFEDYDAWDGKGIRCRLTGKCDGGPDEFEFRTLPFESREKAVESALTYLLIDSKDKNRVGAYLSKLPVANSLEELELKIETLEL